MSWSADKTARAQLLAAGASGVSALSVLVKEHGAQAVVAQLRATGDSALATRLREPDQDHERATARIGARFVTPEDAEWSAALDDLGNAETGRLDPGLGGVPLGLWLRGPLELGQVASSTARSVALVGSRASSSYGDRVASDLAAELATDRSDAAVVVSGGAYGIDAAAHRGALSSGLTCAVLAGGLDEFYPRGNQQLLATVAERGLVISEVAPGRRPTKAGFLARNRLIAALSTAVVVVEAAHRSGALNTVAWANRIQRPVAAVPGPVTSTLSQGTNRLIRQGEAVLVTQASEVWELMLPFEATRPEALRLVQPTLLDDLEAELVAVREGLRPRRPTSIDELTLDTGLGTAQCLAALGELEQRGLVASRPGGWVLARPAS